MLHMYACFFDCYKILKYYLYLTDFSLLDKSKNVLIGSYAEKIPAS